SCCQLLEPLYNTLKQKILEDGYIQADESPIKVLDSDKKGSTHFSIFTSASGNFIKSNFVFQIGYKVTVMDK
ncbi:IS66 family transposase, partial [Salegentibacter sp. LM13S]|uniref:IS66 family transposase n=1 Tax=Salegentibacter lacus TaxID=2873599 RepID=UPI001CCF0A28